MDTHGWEQDIRVVNCMQIYSDPKSPWIQQPLGYRIIAFKQGCYFKVSTDIVGPVVTAIIHF